MAGLSRDAIPFLVVVGLAITQSLTAIPLRQRVTTLYDRWNREATIDKPGEQLPDHLHPEELARFSVDWIGDAAQVPGVVAVPVFGFVLLVEPNLGNVAILAYIFSMILALSAWIFLITTDRPDKYLRHRLLGMTPLTMAIVMINVCCAVVVSLVESA